LTTIGEKITEQAKIILKEARRMDDIVSMERGIVGGNFRLGIIPTIMPTLLPLFLNTFIKKFPKVNLKIEELNTAAIVEELKNGKLDAGIAASPLEDSKLIEKPLYYEPFCRIHPSNTPFIKTQIIEPLRLRKNGYFGP
jgi:LysR family hydrogen peroxide-inducible transcriptional activator